MECPQKYKELGQFYQYYQNIKKAPILTLFVGGNHEASNYLRELYYGGYVAENIYYLGSSGFIWVRKGDQILKVGGISGLEKHYHYKKGFFEEWPYVHNQDFLRSIYHIREFDASKVQLMNQQDIDIFISHEWPTAITNKASYKEKQFLLQRKQHFKNDVIEKQRIQYFYQVNQGRLGSKALTSILESIQPRFWFSAHLHVRFNVQIQTEKGQTVEFLSLDKPLPKRQYLDIFQIGSETKKLESLFHQKFKYQVKKPAEQIQEDANEEDKYDQQEKIRIFHDPQWIAILQQTQQYMPLKNFDHKFDFLTSQNQDLVNKIYESAQMLDKQNLEIVYDEELTKQKYERLNPQTKVFIEKFNLDFRMFLQQDQSVQIGQEQLDKGQQNKEEEKKQEYNIKQTQQLAKDNNEIDLDDI